jgi:hypothetical protein
MISVYVFTVVNNKSIVKIFLSNSILSYKITKHIVVKVGKISIIFQKFSKFHKFILGVYNIIKVRDNTPDF